MAPLNIYCFAHPHGDVYHDDLVYVGEGLEELGHNLYGNRNLWLRTPNASDWLVTHDPAVDYRDCDVVIIAGQYVEYISESTFGVTKAELPSGLFEATRRFKTVLTDIGDGWRTQAWEPWARSLDIILRTKLNCRSAYPANLKPWVLGVSQRVGIAAGQATPFQERARAVLDNFGFSHPYGHGVRKWARKNVYPGLRGQLAIQFRHAPTVTAADGEWNALMNKQTKGKHNPAYYRDLRSYQVISCFCGDWYPSQPADAAVFSGGGGRVAIRRLLYGALDRLSGAIPRLIQWDSWRFWETLACGAVALHFDLAKGGVSLPVMPEPGVHYLACDEKGRIPDEWLTSAALERIAAQGTAWAKGNYSPLKAAERMLSYIK